MLMITGMWMAEHGQASCRCKTGKQHLSVKHMLLLPSSGPFSHFEMMCAELVLPMPGGPLSSTAFLLKSLAFSRLLVPATGGRGGSGGPWWSHGRVEGAVQGCR